MRTSQNRDSVPLIESHGVEDKPTVIWDPSRSLRRSNKSISQFMAIKYIPSENKRDDMDMVCLLLTPTRSKDVGCKSLVIYSFPKFQITPHLLTTDDPRWPNRINKDSALRYIISFLSISKNCRNGRWFFFFPQTRQFYCCCICLLFVGWWHPATLDQLFVFSWFGLLWQGQRKSSVSPHCPSQKERGVYCLADQPPKQPAVESR